MIVYSSFLFSSASLSVWVRIAPNSFLLRVQSWNRHYLLNITD
jgi:hypothetical protein